MGIVVFEWGKHQLTLLQNGEKFRTWPKEPESWGAENKIFPDEDELPENNSATWSGISKRGRVAILVDTTYSADNFSSSVFRPIEFLRGAMSPMDFARRWCQFNKNNLDQPCNMIVADINSNSMVYISKVIAEKTHVHRNQLNFGVHTLSSFGLDSQRPEVKRMETIFCKMMREYEKKKDLSALKKMAENFMYDPVEADRCSSSSSVEKKTFQKICEPMFITALAVEPTKDVKVYERYLENGEWEDDGFDFKID